MCAIERKNRKTETTFVFLKFLPLCPWMALYTKTQMGKERKEKNVCALHKNQKIRNSSQPITENPKIRKSENQKIC
jgi:hypothetical protein